MPCVAAEGSATSTPLGTRSYFKRAVVDYNGLDHWFILGSFLVLGDLKALLPNDDILAGLVEWKR